MPERPPDSEPRRGGAGRPERGGDCGGRQRFRIAADHREKLFEPFFTTKASVGTGWALGSATIRPGHGGVVTVESSTDAIDHGTRFIIFLPWRRPSGSSASDVI